MSVARRHDSCRYLARRCRPGLQLAAAAVLAAFAAVALMGCAVVAEIEHDPPSGTVPATVQRVVDGDTAVFRLEDGSVEKVRFIGVDTPESTREVEPYGREASAYTERTLVVGRPVFLEIGLEERDRYGRLLAYVWLEEPEATSDAEVRAKMFNARLLLDGYAQQMTIQPNSKYADLFRVYAREAREAERGLWALE